MKISGALLAPSMRNPCSNSIRNIPQIPLPESPICYHEHYGFRCIRFSLLGFFFTPSRKVYIEEEKQFISCTEQSSCATSAAP